MKGCLIMDSHITNPAPEDPNQLNTNRRKRRGSDSDPKRFDSGSKPKKQAGDGLKLHRRMFPTSSDGIQPPQASGQEDNIKYSSQSFEEANSYLQQQVRRGLEQPEEDHYYAEVGRAAQRAISALSALEKTPENITMILTDFSAKKGSLTQGVVDS